MPAERDEAQWAVWSASREVGQAPAVEIDVAARRCNLPEHPCRQRHSGGRSA